MSRDPHDPPSVVVTGAGGFIGSHLVLDRLARGERVTALDLRLDRLPANGSAERLVRIEGDCTDAEVLGRALAGADVVFHLAAAHLSVVARRNEYRRVNVDGVRTLVEVAAARGVRRLVHCSSVGVYGRLRDTPADEDTECRPEIPYEATKLEGEHVVREAAAAHGLRVTVLRPAWVYGPGCPRTEKLLRAVSRGRFVVAGSGATLRHCLYIRDMLEIFDRAASAPSAVGATMIAGDRAPVTIRGLIDEIARLAGARPPRAVPLPVLLAAALAAEALSLPFGAEPPISRRSLRFFTGNTAFDTSRARRLLGYEPRFDIHSGLAETWSLFSGGRFWQLPLPERSRA
jgi:nucleoside-diphosphate-sugar epimerase